MLSIENSVIQELFPSFITKGTNRLFVKRDDLIHPEVSGNKWRKLKYNVLAVEQQKAEGIITFGGAFSNHLVATAAMCNLRGLKSVGIVRGEELNSSSNDTLRRCAEFGMQLQFVSREEYALKNDELYVKELHTDFPNYIVVPEGGANYYGIIGCQEVWKELNDHFDFVFIAQGTTTTSLGLLLACPEDTKIVAVPVLKGFDTEGEMKDLCRKAFFDADLFHDFSDKLEILSEYHFGGYAKHTEELLEFMDQFSSQTGVLLDQVYTGKVMFAIAQEIEKRNWLDKKILFIHTGGLQGRLK